MLPQLLFIFIVLVIILRVVWRGARKEISFKETILWLVFWLVVAVAFFVPGFITKLANVFGIGRGADFVFYISFIVIFYIIFKIFVRLDKIEHKLTSITQYLALNNRGFDELKTTNKDISDKTTSADHSKSEGRVGDKYN